MNIFAERLKKTRLLRKLSQKELAERIQISQRSYCRYESGEMFPSKENLISIAEALEISVDYLLDIHTMPNNEIELLNLFRELPKEKHESALQLLKALK